MKTFTFNYLEVSMFGSFPRVKEIKAKNPESALKKLYLIMGNRDFQNIEIKQ